MTASEKISGASVSRRSFVGAAAAACTLLAAGCAPQSQLSETGGKDDAEQHAESTLPADLDESKNGEWVPVPCWMSCGGKCLLKAHVVDGIVTRIKTDDVYEDTIETFQNRGCPRGRSQRKHIFGADRLKYPMKRKNWQPGGGDNINGDLRGKDEWERISWDEAYDLIATEMKRIYDTYGGRSVIRANFGRGIAGSKLLGPLGGYVPFEFCDSYGTHFMYTGNLGGYFNHGEPGGWSTNDRLDLLKTDYIIIEGGNPAWASGGAPMFHLWRAKQAGAQFVYIGPECNLTATTLDAKWIPVRPGTDTAFLLGAAYEMLKLDEERGDIIDWDFLDRCTIGFDADHMPEGASVNENMKDYILGTYDDTPKTAEWASEICGAPVEDIKWYAETVQKNNKCTLLHGYAPSRCNGAENLPQIMETVGCMGGHHGKEGHACGPVYHFWATNDGPALVEIGNPEPAEGTGVAAPIDLTPNPVDDAILTNYLWKTVNEGHYTWFGTVVDYADGTSAVQKSEERDIDIRMIWTDYGNPMTTRGNTNEAIKAFRKVDFVLTLDYVFTPTAQFSDIVLPATTPWEGPGYEDQASCFNTHNRETLYISRWAVAPQFEAKSDREIIETLAGNLGLDTAALFPYTTEEMHAYRIANATVVQDDGVTFGPLVTITQEDIDRIGVKGIVPQEGKISWDEIVKTGIYHVPRKEGDNLGWIAYKDFREDPEGNPRSSASGKIELFCQAKTDIIDRLGFSEEGIKPYATYLRPLHGYEDSFEDWEAKKKGEYPLQVFNSHYLRRAHSAFDTNVWLREAFKSPVFINASDAAERGIENGDWVRVFNDSGEFVRQASVVETMMPGCVDVPHGSWPEFTVDGISINGGPNLLNDSSTSAGVQQGYNTVLCQIEKYEDQNILPDAERPVIMPGIE